ncbi:ATP-dependent RNA helicase [Agarivorans sp. OAG1]|uniref:ATP-dependent 23S rRNA helicase DbpA n=1 Tax=Agarivorans albus MKT 106 TaxID=1331007 RepID=R9PG06_AGAAL|nr:MULTISPECIES: ATP-dependent RNA helicase DbpA [Agarivorans]MPW30338.1 ATP-dependent RNA helicase DbpA [Agarivorans sp. B2Z047]UQN43033.1 ATP-dependent RNA helicase DbpA [Agarivorans sp. B2Z047]BEU01340.1 ATP-dependent RNA helicase [Agarivorans sp. OAG1]GAD00188.1 ATP-dependent 23S rRNA helicase DbpA [Agarivorans albus MKT 106]
MSQTDFSTLALHPDLLKNLETLGYSSMTPIQAQSLPLILDGKDVIAQGKTGSGKTAAFGLGLLNALEVKRFRIQTLVLCPTRELADQVAKEIRKLARSIHNIKVLTLCGGMPFGPQIGSLEHGAHIVVGTPGRIEEHLRKGTLRLDNVKNLILDEADRMLEMGFQSAIDAIIELAPKQRQTLLFSATFPEQIESIANNIMHQPVRVEVASTHDNSSISQHFFKVDDNEQRMLALRLLLLQHRPKSSVVFCNTKREAQEVADELSLLGFSALALHGDLEQRERDQTLVQFANNSAAILVATDVAARGLDIDSLDAVFNYHLARDTEVHVHRIGRTGRAGSKGIACSFFSDKEHYKVALLEDYLGRSINDEELPSMALLNKKPAAPLMATLQIDGGKKQKVRAGDILGALTGENGIAGAQVGKINLFDNRAYVAVEREALKRARKKLEDGKMKGRSFRVRHLPC